MGRPLAFPWPPMGPLERMSSSTAALAAYLAGRITVTPTTTARPVVETATAGTHRARRMAVNWERFMTAPRPMGTSADLPRGCGPAWERPGARPAGLRCRAVGAWRSSGRSEQALAHVDHVAGAQQLGHAGLDHLDLAVAVAAVDLHAALGASLGEATAAGQGLHQRHVGDEGDRAGALHLAVDVDGGQAVDVERVAVEHDRVL